MDGALGHLQGTQLEYNTITSGSLADCASTTSTFAPRSFRLLAFGQIGNRRRITSRRTLCSMVDDP